ncbi:site-specific integrase [Pseudomonas sp. NPDC086251]|uniref:site-specific integrase n=1 Tax=Pseudomonas sp. NPDC086251 TaxID=3364431 RepID=UPI003833FA5F
MKIKASLTDTPMFFDSDLTRTERSDLQNMQLYWGGDVLVHTGQDRFIFTKALMKLNPSLKESFKQHLILFSSNGCYAKCTYRGIISALARGLKTYPTSSFDTNWIAKALTCPSFHRSKWAIVEFFLLWQERDNTVISTDALRLLKDTNPKRAGPRNVLSDDPTKSWLTEQEYECLLGAVWNNYDKGISGTQVTLIKLLSMQYARRPIQIAYLKIGDIRKHAESNNTGLKGKFIFFPGAKDSTSVTGFRDSKFEPHPLADHLWDLCHIQCREVKSLYENILGFSLTHDQLNKLPLFCSEPRAKQALKIIAGQLQINILENLDSELFHLRKSCISYILRWAGNSPISSYGASKSYRLLPAKPPISARTGQAMVVSATRMRHTRARQLARQGIPHHMLSHWLGHSSEHSLAAYYNDPAEQARQLDEAMAPALAPFAMAFAGTLIDSTDQVSRPRDQSSKLEFDHEGKLKSVGHCGKLSFCATTSIPIPCYRCKHFEPFVDAPHQEVLEALIQRQAAEKQVIKIGGSRNLLIPIDLSADIHAVENCIARCNARTIEKGR